MTGSGILEGKKGMAAYLTPRVIGAAARILYMVSMVALMIFAAYMFADSMQELQTLVESGEMPRCVMTVPLSGMLLLFAYIMMVRKR